MRGLVASLRVLATVLLWSGLSACSVGMALSGEENPDLGAVRMGAQRGEVELHLGAPIQTVSLQDGGRADVYEYQIGNAPSAGRAIGHGMMDVLTFGLWEVVGTPIEGVQGETYHHHLRSRRQGGGDQDQEAGLGSLVVWIRQMISTRLVAQTTRIMGLVGRKAPSEGNLSFGSNH